AGKRKKDCRSCHFISLRSSSQRRCCNMRFARKDVEKIVFTPALKGELFFQELFLNYKVL
ncbi:MAG: hypothetical protein WAV86_14910, partial [Lutibacter sp.]